MFRTLITTALRQQSVYTLRASGVRGLAVAANDGALRLNFRVPHEEVVDSPVQSVTIPATSGYMGVVSGHVPTIAELKPGVVTVVKSDGGEDKYFVNGGFAFVTKDNECNVSVLEACAVDELDVDHARKELESALSRYQSAQTDQDKGLAQVSIDLHQAVVSASESGW
jgi:F-type H+-transporting ATPase subunit delta